MKFYIQALPIFDHLSSNYLCDSHGSHLELVIFIYTSIFFWCNLNFICPSRSNKIKFVEIHLISQYLYRNVQFSKASLNGVLFYESILRREETGVPRGNSRSQVEIDWKLNPHTTFVVEVEGVIDVHYASLASKGVQDRVFLSRWSPIQISTPSNGALQSSNNRKDSVLYKFLSCY